MTTSEAATKLELARLEAAEKKKDCEFQMWQVEMRFKEATAARETMEANAAREAAREEAAHRRAKKEKEREKKKRENTRWTC